MFPPSLLTSFPARRLTPPIRCRSPARLPTPCGHAPAEARLDNCAETGVYEDNFRHEAGGTPQAPLGSEAWRGSIEIAIAKAYTAMAFSSNQQALDSRTVGLLARLDVPELGAPNPGTNTGPAPLFGIGDTNPYRPLTGTLADDAVGLRHHGLVTFAGGQPVYDCQAGVLLGGVGVSGDEVDQDDTVARGAVTGAGFCLQP
jgi:uncharacterized protein GlcG (DUF336 family)